MSYIGQGLPADTFQGFVTDSFTGDGSATTFTLSKEPFSEDTLIVVINNVIQKPTTNFTVSGTTLTIVGTAVADGDVIYAIHMGGPLPIGGAAELDLNGASDKLILDADGDTTISADTDDQIDFKLGGVDEMTMSSSGIVINEGSNDRDFRIESNGKANMFFVDGGNDKIGINTTGSTPSQVTIEDVTGNGGGTLGLTTDTSGTSDNLGRLHFGNATDGSLAAIFGIADGANDAGALTFRTEATGAALEERMRIESDGSVCIGTTSTASMLNVTQASTGANMANIVSNSSYGNHMFYMSNASSGTTTFNFVICYSGTTSDIELRIKGNGAVTSDSAYSSSGGDYAEMFEWKDGNSSSEDRAGYSVVLDGEKIVKATDSDDASKIVGVVSGNPSVIGDADADKWKKKYLKDDFNRFIMEEHTVTTWTEKTYTANGSANPEENISYHTDRIPSDVTVPTEDIKDSEGRVIKTKAVVVTTVDDSVTKLTRKKLNPDWDSSKTYVPREDRKEWDVVGLMGKLRMLKGQPTGTNWIKMRDISDTVEEWLIR